MSDVFISLRDPDPDEEQEAEQPPAPKLGRAAAAAAAAAKRRQEFIEERTFFREICQWDDRRIAARLGIPWEAYRRRFLRNPELGEIVDPVTREANAADGWAKILAPHRNQARNEARNEARRRRAGRCRDE